MRKFSWTDDELLRFVQAYRSRECLWDSRCRAYSNKALRAKAYDSMIRSLKLPNLLTAKDVIAKVKTVRTLYGKELAKIRSSEKSGAGAEDVYVPAGEWFAEADAFLRRGAEPRQSSSTLDVSITASKRC